MQHLPRNRTSRQKAGRPLTACTSHKSGRRQHRHEGSHDGDESAVAGRLHKEGTGLRIGPRTKPCGTPQMTADREDVVAPQVTMTAPSYIRDEPVKR